MSDGASGAHDGAESLSCSPEDRELRDRGNRLLRALRFGRTMTNLARAGKRGSHLAEAVCQSLVDSGLFATAWVILVDEDEVNAAGVAGVPADVAGRFASLAGRGSVPPCCGLVAGKDICASVRGPAELCNACPLATLTAGRMTYVVPMQFGNESVGLLGVSIPAGACTDEAFESEVIEALASDLAVAFRAVDLEERKRHGDAFLHAALQALPEYMAVLDESGTVLAASKAPDAFAAHLGISAAELRRHGNYLSACGAVTGERWAAAQDFVRGARAVVGGQAPSFEAEFPVAPPGRGWRRIRVVGLQVHGRRYAVVEQEDITRRVDAEQQVRENEAYFRSVFQTTPDAMIIADAESGLILEANPAASELLGRSPSELVGIHHTKLHPPADTEAYVKAFRRQAATGATECAEAEVVTRDGTKVPVRLHSTVIQARGRKVLLGIFHSLREEKAARVALEESQRKLATLIENLPGAAYRGYDDPWMPPDYLSPKIAAISGYTDADFLPGGEHSLASLMHPEDLPAVHQQVRDAIDQRGSFSVEYRIRARDGAERWVADHGASVGRDDSGRTLVEGILLDITDRKQAEIEYAAAVRTALDGYMLVDRASTHLVDVNASLCAITGYTREHLLGMSVCDLEFNRSPDEVREHASRILAAGSDRFETRFRHRSGSAIDVELAVTAVRTRGGAFAVFVRDITQYKLAEAEVRNARVAAENANEAKSRFLAGMSHELRTPLNGIIGFADLLLRSPDVPEKKRVRSLEHIRKSGEHLLGLINDLLDIAKVDAGKMEISWEAVALETVVRTAVALTEADWRSKQIAMRLPCLERPLHVHADTRLTQQVLLNLLSNAIKFTPDGGVVTVDAESVDLDWVRVRVEDTGVGVPRDKQGQLFTEFLQVDATRDSNLGGSGLGLSLCRRFVELQGGEIGFESEPGEGSRFWFTLQRATGDAQTGAPRAMPDESAPAADMSSRFAGKTILVAEDNLVNMELIREMLESLGCAVHAATDGREAVEAAEQLKPDLILMDIRMPGMDGLEATRHLRASETNQRTPIVALTASADAGARQETRQAGCNSHLTKPLGYDSLVAELERFLA